MAKAKKPQNKPKQAARRADGTLLPGSTANPGGRPKGQMTLVKELLLLGPLALKNLNAALVEGEKWATEMVISAISVKELIAAAMLEKDVDETEFDWTKVGDDEVAKVISIARKAQAKSAAK